ncbi:MAG: sensor histidine kinase, partial [Myxococcaceae bacterium]|nr:sensor histidine kinase [Myxococcaceae bacterium]
DGLGASLSSLIIQSEYLASLAKEEQLLKEIGELKASAEESIEELRRSLRMMREDFDLASGLEDYVKTFGERTQLPVSFQKSGEYIGKLPPESSLALFRVLQELLTNALKHAQARQVEVRMAFLPERVQLTVKDDGRGFDPAAPRPGHYGLINLQERANKVGATVSVDSRPGAGAHVTFSVPLST